ncbi:MmgE/PrpD family protein [Pseudonocardia ailaonensis]|uniref:MmgE/PrpD family protein n=1 Tax=Pseudonocardia ailaonensis TaxID=367279 RepID=A0ABN2N3Q9_9PSEU
MSATAVATDVATELGEWGSTLTWAGLPERIRADVRLTWLDTLGSLYLGRDHPEVRQLAEALGGSGDSPTVLGPRLGARDACLVNGLALGVDLLDGGNVASGGHVAGYIMPAVIAEAAARNDTLESALVGFLTGYEIACRIGSSQRLRPSLHPSGTWNVIGAAVAVARMRGAGPAELARTIALAANLTLTTSWDATVHGATVRDVYHGMPSHLGTLAADLALAGFTGGPRSVEVTFGELSSIAPFDREAATRGLGERWLLDETYTKIHPTCRSFHAALDAALLAFAELPPDIDLDGVEVTIGTEPFAFQQNIAVHSESDLAARESLPVSAALALVTGRLTPQQYRDGDYRAERVLGLAERLTVVCEPRATERSRPGWVRVQGSGLDVHRTVDIPAGNPGNLLPAAVVVDKFRGLAAPLLGDELETTVAELLTGPVDAPCLDVLKVDRWKA